MQLKTTLSKSKVDITGLKLLKLVGEDLSSTQFEDLDLDALSIGESTLTECAFRNITTRSASFGGGRKQSVYTDCLFDQCRFEVGVAGNARFSRCEFKSCKLTRIFGVALELIDCKFPATTIGGSVFHGKVSVDSPVYAHRNVNEFRGNDFSSSELIDTDFRGGIHLDENCLPHGRGYLFVKDIPRALQAGEALRTSLIDPADQKKLQKFIRRLSFAASHGQESTLLLTAELGAFEDEWRRLIAAQ